MGSVPPDLIRAIELRAAEMAAPPPPVEEDDGVAVGSDDLREEDAAAAIADGPAAEGTEPPGPKFKKPSIQQIQKELQAEKTEIKGSTPDGGKDAKPKDPGAARYFVGIDWSHTSPAVAIVTPQGRLHVAAFHRTAKCEGKVESSTDLETKEGLHQGRIVLTLIRVPDWEKFELAKTDPRRQYLLTQFHTEQMVNFIVNTVKQSVFELDQEFTEMKFDHLRMEMFVEDYAYGVAQKNPKTPFLLAEDCGAFKLDLFRAFKVAPAALNITQVKKAWAGSGTASKEHMCKMWRARGLPGFNLPCCVNEQNHLQSPYNDMVDAAAVVYTAMREAGVEFITELPKMTSEDYKKWRLGMIERGSEFRKCVKKEDA